MGLENVKCYDCDQYGHLSKDCPGKNYAAELGDGKPPWCQSEICDRETRLVYTETADGLKASRCPACHPQSHTLPAQFAKCRGCGHIVYQWDKRSECGSHLPVGKRLEYVNREKRNKDVGKGESEMSTHCQTAGEECHDTAAWAWRPDGPSTTPELLCDEHAAGCDLDDLEDLASGNYITAGSDSPGAGTVTPPGNAA